MTDLPQITPDDLATRLDGGEPLQVLDIRATHTVAQGHLQFGAALDFKAMPGSELYRLESLDPLQLNGRVAVVCGHGNSSRRMTLFLRERGVEAYSLVGGMAAWESVYVMRRLAATPSLEHVIQLDRIGRGALSYLLASDGAAVVVDPGRHIERYSGLVEELGVRPVAVLDTHCHADYLSGGPALAQHWGVPYRLHVDDTRSPFDDTPGSVAVQPLSDGDQIAFGRATLRVEHFPGHTLGSVAFVSDDGLALTGDFLFVKSIGRPDLGGKADAWTRLLWQSLERVRRRWPGDRVMLPAHYSSEAERRADRAVAARFDVLAATNEGLAIQDERAFAAWIAARSSTPPASYRTIKLANLGLAHVSPAQAEELEVGQNLCAI